MSSPDLDEAFLLDEDHSHTAPGTKGGAKRKENELRRVFAVKLKEAKTEADAAMERLRRQHHTEMNTLRQAREKRQQEHDRKVEELNKEVTRLKGQVLLLTANRNKAAACKENEAPSNDDKTDTAQHTDKGNDTSDDNSQGVEGEGLGEGVENLPAQVMELKNKVCELSEELEFSSQLFHDLSVYCNANKATLNHAKDVLVNVGSVAFPDVLPTYTFCEASPEEVERALLEAQTQGGETVEWALDEIEDLDVQRELGASEEESVLALSRPPRAASRTHPVYGNHPNKHYLVPIRLLDKALEEVDLAVRDARFDPFTRADGDVVSVDWDHERLVSLSAKYGRPLAEVVVAKKREVDKYCPSGGYPTPVLFEEGRELSLGEAILRLIKALKEARAKAENISKGTQPAHRPRHQSGPHAYLDVDPELANTLPYLTRHTIHGAGASSSGSSSGSTAPPSSASSLTTSSSSSSSSAPLPPTTGGVLPDCVGHIFVRWLRVKREVKEGAGWHYFRVANAALAQCLKPQEQQCQSEEECRRWVEMRSADIATLKRAIDRNTRVPVNAVLHFLHSRNPKNNKPPSSALPSSKPPKHSSQAPRSAQPSTKRKKHAAPHIPEVCSSDESDSSEDDDKSTSVELYSVDESWLGGVLSVMRGFMLYDRGLPPAVVEKLLCVSGGLVTEAVKAAKDIDNTQDLALMDSLDVCEVSALLRAGKGKASLDQHITHTNTTSTTTDDMIIGDGPTPTGDGKVSEHKAAKEVYGFCLAVGRLKNKALTPQDVWTIKGGGRGLGKNVKRGFEAWLRDHKQMVRSDVIKAYSQILDGTLRDATALSSSSATINSTRALEAALTSTQVLERVGDVLAVAGDRRRKAWVLLWEWVMGEEVEWRDLVPMMQALAASTHTHKTHMEEEESEEESDESSEEEEEEVGEWLEEAVFGPGLLTEMSAWATTHPTQPMTYTKARAWVCEVSALVLDLWRIQSGGSLSLTSARHYHSQPPHHVTSQPYVKQLCSKGDVKALLTESRALLPRVLGLSPHTAHAHRHDAGQRLLRFLKLGKLLSTPLPPPPDVPPLPTPLIKRFEAYLTKAEGLANPAPYVRALESLYAAAVNKRRQAGGCREVKIILDAAADSSSKGPAVTEPLIASLLKTSAELMKEEHTPSHAERAALKYLNDMVADMGQDDDDEACATTAASGKGRAAATRKRQHDANNNKRKVWVEAASKKARREGSEWRALSQAVIGEFKAWILTHAEQHPAQEGAVSGGVVSEEGLLFVDSMFKTLVMKHNTLMHRADVKRLLKGYPGHLQRIADRAEDPAFKEVYALFSAYVLDD